MCVNMNMNMTAQSPLILIGGAAATVLRGRGSLQDVEQVSVILYAVRGVVFVAMCMCKFMCRLEYCGP